MILTLLMCAQVIWYAYSGNGFALVFAIVLGAMALVLRNSYQKANRAIAKAFEEEGDQACYCGGGEALPERKRGRLQRGLPIAISSSTASRLSIRATTSMSSPKVC